jgi:hypothetical protein
MYTARVLMRGGLSGLLILAIIDFAHGLPLVTLMSAELPIRGEAVEKVVVGPIGSPKEVPNT